MARENNVLQILINGKNNAAPMFHTLRQQFGGLLKQHGTIIAASVAVGAAALVMGKKIARAGKMAEFRDLLHTVPDESLIYHSERNHFSSWLMARGEIQIAKFIQPLKISLASAPWSFK